MASFVKFFAFVEAMAEKKHNLGSDTLKVALSNTAPSQSNAILTDITEISYTNYSSRTVTVSASSQTSGTYKLVCNDLTLTISGGAGAGFRYVILYNDTATNDDLIGYYDRGSTLTPADGDTFLIDFDGSAGVLTLA